MAAQRLRQILFLFLLLLFLLRFVKKAMEQKLVLRVCNLLVKEHFLRDL